MYNLHRSPYFWDNPQEFEPERFLRTKESNGIEGWAGFEPSRSPGALYPNEVNIQNLQIQSFPLSHCLLVASAFSSILLCNKTIVSFGENRS